MNKEQRLRLRREVAIRADQFYDEGEAQRFGQTAHQNHLKKGQIKNLQSVAESALKVSDVLDYVKIQSGKHDDWRRNNFGPDLLNHIRHQLLKSRNEICATLGFSTSGIEAQTVYLHLIRAFIRQVAAHYEYKGGTE
jgi:hypothetical protein